MEGLQRLWEHPSNMGNGAATSEQLRSPYPGHFTPVEHTTGPALMPTWADQTEWPGGNYYEERGTPPLDHQQGYDQGWGPELQEVQNYRPRHPVHGTEDPPRPWCPRPRYPPSLYNWREWFPQSREAQSERPGPSWRAPGPGPSRLRRGASGGASRGDWRSQGRSNGGINGDRWRDPGRRDEMGGTEHDQGNKEEWQMGGEDISHADLPGRPGDQRGSKSKPSNGMDRAEGLGGFQRDLSRTSDSSQSRVRWGSEWYDGEKASESSEGERSSMLSSAAAKSPRNEEQMREENMFQDQDRRADTLRRSQVESVQRRLEPVLCTMANDGVYFLALAKSDGVPYLPSVDVERSPTPSEIFGFSKSLYGQHVPIRLEDRARLDLDRPVTLEELSQTVKSMARGKSSGIDGLTVEFYSTMWDSVGPNLVELYNQILVDGRLGKGMAHGVIRMLFKKGDKSEVIHWRPISLLNVSYKILAKTLARRLGEHLPGLVEGDQGAFVRGRFIFNNIVTALEVLEVVQSEGMNTSVLLLDLEKAYDKVGWPFVFTTLRKMGFGTPFCKWLVAMYTFSSSAVMINGHLSKPFKLSRSLRQGCPLAPLLFVLQMEVLLNRIRRNPNIRGLTLHSGSHCEVKALADDLFVISENPCTSLIALKDVLSEYSSLSEASVNWNKSVFMLPVQFEPAVQWGMKRIGEGEEERFLGVLISLQSETSAQGLLLQQRVATRLRTWGVVWHLSIIGRVLVANVALFSIFWFVCTVREISESVWRIVKRVVARFIWKPGGKEGEGFITKVAWDLLTFPRCEGGLNLVAPVKKNQAQLSSWVCKVANAPVKEHWMELAEQILIKEWGLSRPLDVWRCLFIPSFRRKRVKSRFWKEVLKAWNSLPPETEAAPQTKKEVQAKTLFENPQLLDKNGNQFMADGSPGSFGKAWIRKGVSTVGDLWNPLLGTWRQLDNLLIELSPLRNMQVHLQQLLGAIPIEWKNRHWTGWLRPSGYLVLRNWRRLGGSLETAGSTPQWIQKGATVEMQEPLE
ncbi:hypothetical protein CBR_g52223 [Chara braunii]|uniref:Reverse transcriptase domain-containing protein n=1 Tax=Chara braunii TaxID=69332 RepID=A0A388M9T5_CHABU|nr:hypothetical protein CBR_g52223 [Chara braunii]|eukprot:GBG91337.1 hypothetical protein CBR_g52223 [Chara braunii]